MPAFNEVLTNFTFKLDKGKVRALNKGTTQAVNTLKAATKENDKLNETVKNGIDKVKQFVGAYIGFRAVKSVTTDIASQVTEIERGAKFVGVTVERMQELRHAGLRNKLQFDDLTDVMKELAVKANDAFGLAASNDARELFKQMGIVKSQLVDSNGQLKQTDELLMVVADAYSKMGNKAKQAAAIDDLLSDSGRKAAKFLALGRKGIERFAKEAHDRGIILDERTIRAAKRYKKVKGEIIVTLTAFRNTIASAILPVLASTVEWFHDLWLRTRESDQAIRILKITAIATGAIIANIFAIKGVNKAKGYIIDITKSLRTFNTTALITNFYLTLIIASVALLILGIEDLIGFVQGRDSLIGRLLGDSDTAKALKDAIVGIGVAAVEAWGKIKPELLAAWNEMKPAIAALWAAAKPLIGPAFKVAVFLLINGFRNLALFIKIAAFFVKQFVSNLRLIGGSIKTALGPVGSFFTWLVKQLEKVVSLMEAASGKTALGGFKKLKEEAMDAAVEELQKGTTEIGPRGETVTTRYTKPIKEILGIQHRQFIGPGEKLPGDVAPMAFVTQRPTMPATQQTTANVAPGAVQVSVITQADDPAAVAREVNNLVTTRVSAMFTDASRNLNKPPQGQR